MRILNLDTDKTIDNVLILLTYQEACEVKDDLERLVSSNQQMNHSHISDAELKREITFSIYNKENMDKYQERIKRLIIQET